MGAIAVLDDYQKVALKMADWSGLTDTHKLKIFHEPFASLDAAAEALKDFDIVCAMRERTLFSRQMLERLPRLRLLVTTGHRNAAIDLAAAADRNVLVCGTPAPGTATAELAWGLILALARHIAFEREQMRNGQWQTTVGIDLKGKTLGIIGLGKLGSRMARYAQAFEMSVVAWSQNLTLEAAQAAGARRVEKDELLRAADVVTIHTKLSERTMGLIGARELALMKPTALLINTSRGPIIDEAALLQALRSQKLGGAGIDVYDREPLPPEHPLRSEPRALVTPHLGYVTEDTYRQFYGGTVAAVEAWLQGRPIHVLTA
jgi:phosphoglycerate dehydrogenase-like enzyme